jgi:hypothetical protein
MFGRRFSTGGGNGNGNSGNSNSGNNNSYDNPAFIRNSSNSASIVTAGLRESIRNYTL